MRAFGVSKSPPHVVEEKFSLAMRLPNVLIKFSASALATTKDLIYKSMTSKFQHLQDFTLVGKIYDHIESGLGFNRVMLNALVMATIEKQLDPAHMSLCLCIPLFSTILFLKSPTKKSYIILPFWKRFEHPNFPWERYLVCPLSATLVMASSPYTIISSLCVA